MPKVSVIVPVYGVEKYIERCARSLFEQTLDDIEYLFIDDCTLDKSIEVLKSILEEYPNRKPQVIIHRMEQNSGQAAVRKWGMLNATGEYVIHCDSDDWVDEDAYRICYENANNGKYDMVYFDFNRYTNNCISLINRNVPNNKRELISGLLSGDVMGSLCGCLVKASLAKNILFEPVADFTEDLVIILQYVFLSNKYLYIRQPLYYYRENINSITEQTSKDKALSRFHQGAANIKVIESFLVHENELSNFQFQLISLKLKRIINLRNYSRDTGIQRMCIDSFPDVNFSTIFNSHISFEDRFIYLLFKLRLFGYIKAFKMCLRKI